MKGGLRSICRFWWVYDKNSLLYICFVGTSTPSIKVLRTRKRKKIIISNGLGFHFLYVSGFWIFMSWYLSTVISPCPTGVISSELPSLFIHAFHEDLLLNIFTGGHWQILTQSKSKVIEFIFLWASIGSFTRPGSLFNRSLGHSEPFHSSIPFDLLLG